MNSMKKNAHDFKMWDKEVIKLQKKKEKYVALLNEVNEKLELALQNRNGCFSNMFLDNMSDIGFNVSSENIESVLSLVNRILKNNSDKFADFLKDDSAAIEQKSRKTSRKNPVKNSSENASELPDTEMDDSEVKEVKRARPRNQNAKTPAPKSEPKVLNPEPEKVETEDEELDSSSKVFQNIIHSQVRGKSKEEDAPLATKSPVVDSPSSGKNPTRNDANDNSEVIPASNSEEGRDAKPASNHKPLNFDDDDNWIPSAFKG